MKKTQHIAQFESFHEDPRINDYDYVNSIICITDYNGTIAVGMVGNQRDRVYIEMIQELEHLTLMQALEGVLMIIGTG